MLRTGLIAIVCLCAAGCDDLTRVEPPPVPLSAVDSVMAGIDGDTEDPAGSPSMRLVRAIAPGSLVTLHVPDIDGTIRRFKKTSLYDLFTSPALSQFFTPMTSGFDMAGSGGGIDGARLLRSMMRGEFIIALEDFELDHTGKPASARIVAAITVAGAVREAEKLIEFITMAMAATEGVRIEKGSVGQTPFTRVVAKKPEPIIVEFALVDEAIVVGIGRESATQAIERLQSKDKKSISDDPSFQRCMERCADPRDAVRVHVDIASVFQRFGRLIPEEALHFLRVAGIDKFRSLSVAFRLEGKDVVVSTFLDSPGGKDFLTSLLAANPVDRQFFSRIPKDASSFSIFALDGQRVLDHLRKNLRPKYLEALEAGLKAMRDDGVDLEQDILQVFGPRCALVTLPHGAPDAEPLEAIWNHILGTALIVDVHDPAAAQQTLAKLAKVDSLRRRKYKVHDTDVVAYTVDVGQLPDELAPAYAYVDDFLVVALSDQTMARMLEPRRPDTADGFRDMFKKAPAMAAALSYDDTSRGLGLMVNAILAGLRSGMRSGLPNRAGVPDSIPSFAWSGVSYGWNPSVSWTVADDGGIFMHTRSPTAGFGGMGGVTGLLLLGSIAIPNFTVARHQTNESAAMATLHQIRTAQQTFRANAVRDDDNDNDGEYGFLTELIGKRRPGDTRMRRGPPLVTGLKRDGKTYRSRGYYFRVYLPREDGSPVGGHEDEDRIKLVDGDLSEAVMVVAAWPVNSGTGARAFLMDADGEIYACEDEFAYVGKKSPPPDVLRSQRNNLASARLDPSKARDGHVWVKVND